MRVVAFFLCLAFGGCAGYDRSYQFYVKDERGREAGAKFHISDSKSVKPPRIE